MTLLSVNRPDARDPAVSQPLSLVTQVTREWLYRPVLQVGDRGDSVVELQKLLTHWQIPVSLDGVFTPQLELAVRQFQRRVFLPENGRVGPPTWQALYTGGPLNMPELQLGAMGTAVRLLQQALQAAGDFRATVHGCFDHQTEQAVRSFQWRQGLVVDGRVGPCTWRALSKVPR
jgi:peptidoglycan hydrolase-like protein with peptidoglycan-binding domain